MDSLRLTMEYKKLFKCPVCKDDFKNPMELACRHVGCKRCLLGCTECPVCCEKIVTIGWKTRADITKIQRTWLKLMGAFTVEKLAANNVKANSPTVVGEITPAADTSAATDPKDTLGCSGGLESIITNENGNTCETHFDECSEMFGNPNTPAEPYPFNTQVAPGQLRSRDQERTPDKVNPILINQREPLIDTQFFTAWDTQNQNEKSPRIIKKNEDRLTQSQPLDLTVQEHETDPDELIHVPPHAMRRPRPGFSPARPLDLRYKTRANNSPQRAISAKETLADVGVVECASSLPVPILPDLELLNSKPSSPTPLPQRTLSALPVTPILEKQRGLPVPICTTPRRQKQLRKSDSLSITPEVPRTAQNDTRCVPDPVDLGDCMNLVNGHKRRPGPDDMTGTSSDEELFPVTIPSTKRQKVSGNVKQKKSGSISKNQQLMDHSKTPHSNNNNAEFPRSENTPVDPELGQTASDDLFCRSWNPAEDLLHSESIPRAFVFCPTRLHPDQLPKLEEFCTLCSGEIRKEFSEDVTHLLLNIEKKGISYTLKYLMAIALKKWVLTFDWVEECLKQHQVVPEEAFETSNFAGGDQAVKVSRLSPINLFDGFEFYVPFDIKSSSITASDCKQLLNALGGIILEELPTTNKPLLVVGDLSNFTINYQKLYEDMGWLTVAWDWILDCVLSYKLLPFSAEYILTPGVDGIVLSQASVPLPLLNV